MWRLGGKESDFRMLGRRSRVPAPSGGTRRQGQETGPRTVTAAQFAWQHDVQRHADGTLRVFDNASAPPVRRASRALFLRLDEQARTATVASVFEHPDDLLAGTQANVQALPNGTLFVGWGSQGYFSELTPDGAVLFDARVARGNGS